MAGYLFAHFIGEQKDGEQIYFAISRDGLHWQDLSMDKPILKSSVGECGARDPFCVKHPQTGKYYLIATDLRIEAGKGWKVAQFEGSRNLLVWESEDLIHWTTERAVSVGVEGAGCVWAPEAVWDEDKEAFFVFWASMTDEGEVPKQKIYCAYTKDFTTFSPIHKYIEKSNHVIDTTMIYTDGYWFRFSKDETTKRICMEKSSNLAEEFSEVSSPVLENLFGVEGPEIFILPDGRYCLIVDQFASNGGYLPLVADCLSSGNFQILNSNSYDMGKLKKRHGGIIRISDEEYNRLKDYYDNRK